MFLLANCFLKFCSLGNTLLFQAYLDELVELHRRLMTLRERHILQQIVNLIEETGHFHITNTTFDFDLCSLDKTTVRKLQSYLETSGTSWGYNNWTHQKLFFLVVIFFLSLLLFIWKHSEWYNQKGKKIKTKQPSALLFFKASHHLLIKERLPKPASADTPLQGKMPRKN